MKKLIESLESLIIDPTKGLPEDIFLFIARVTPMINVDLLIKNKQGQTLLTWRDDEYFPPGWHIPGGIVRYKETFADRINAVAASELGAKVKFNRTPLAINEVILPPLKNRAHFISVLYECLLLSQPNQRLRYTKDEPEEGQWAWYAKCPKNIIAIHRMYRKFF